MSLYYDAVPASVVAAPSVFGNEALIPYKETNTSNAGLQLLCDWPRSVKDCRDSDFMLFMLIISAGFHFTVGLFGIRLILFRNKGHDRGMVKGLFKAFSTNFDPDVVGNYMFFSTVACFIKVAGNTLLIVHAPKWLCIALDQLYWLCYIASIIPYGIDGLSTIPVTERKGMFAVYTPGSGSTGFPQLSIAFFYPTRSAKAAHFALWISYTLTFAFSAGVASGILQDRGYDDAARILEMVQYFSWVLLFWVNACLLLYYGYKVRLILRACINMAEVTRDTPLEHPDPCSHKRRSPVRPLSIITQILAFGAAFVFIIAGSLCCVWARWKGTIRRAEDTLWPRVLAVVWTCADGIAILVILILIIFFFNIVKEEPEDCNGNSNNPPWSSRLSADDHNDIDSPAMQMQHSIAFHPDAYQANGRAFSDQIARKGLCDGPVPASIRDKKKKRKGSVSKGMTTICKNASKDHISGDPLLTEALAEHFPPPSLHESTIAARMHLEPSARERRVPEVQKLQLECQSIQRRIQWLCILVQQQTHSEEEQRQLHALETKVQEVHQQLQRLEAAKDQYLVSQKLLQTVERHDYMASIRHVCLLNDMCALELQVESSLCQLIRNTERYSFDTTAHHIPVTASSSSATLKDILWQRQQQKGPRQGTTHELMPSSPSPLHFSRNHQQSRYKKHQGSASMSVPLTKEGNYS